MGRFTLPFTPRQIKAVSIVPKVFSAPSIIGSIIIIQHILKNHKRRNRVYHRLILLMSINDFIFAIKSFLSTWPIPSTQLYTYGNVGTVQTCTAAGFLGHGSSLSSIFYNASLTTYFLLVVRYGWKEEHMKKQNVESTLHIIPLLIGWSTAIAGIPLTLYNAFGWTCWINTFPPGCTDNVNCLRGDNAGIYRWAFFHAELWLIFGYTIIAMSLIYNTVLTQERKIDQYTFGANHNKKKRSNSIDDSTDFMSSPTQQQQQQQQQQQNNNNNNNDFANNVAKVTKKKRTMSNKFANQALMFVIVFFFTWFFPMLQAVFGQKRDILYYPLILLSSILVSLQGFFNAIIYLRPRWLRLRKKYPTLYWYEVIAISLSSNDHRNQSYFGTSINNQSSNIHSFSAVRRMFSRISISKISSNSNNNNSMMSSHHQQYSTGVNFSTNSRPTSGCYTTTLSSSIGGGGGGVHSSDDEEEGLEEDKFSKHSGDGDGMVGHTHALPPTVKEEYGDEDGETDDDQDQYDDDADKYLD